MTAAPNPTWGIDAAATSKEVDGPGTCNPHLLFCPHFGHFPKNLGGLASKEVGPEHKCVTALRHCFDFEGFMRLSPVP